ncbi:hypothetical protein DT73_15670 [Mangrovibacter sp. MFB070]|uniref:MFS transporter n=1 Tax=Mangrovibacter sp. MFB070 TaxID=1224318 RepID=UPI0004D38E5A|nr:MFS transporter [Mangrovibacter sp. MFB070]KEA52326.1 hypothetical protein DT73_15670 [Mangrovibacter sp. MFB070]
MNQTSPGRHTLTMAGLLLLVAGQLMPQMDFSIVNVALESVSISLHASKTQLGLIVSLYGLAFAVSLALSGRLGDRYGRRRLFMLGIALFAIASFFCGLATTIHQLIVARIAQGVAAALLMPQILATIHVSLSGTRHSQAIGIYGSVGGLSFVIGQALGGWLVSADLFGLSWRAVFYINLPVCLVILYFARKFIPETQQDGQTIFDWYGTALLALVITLILTAISWGPDWQWGWPVWLCAAAVIALLPGLVRVEKRLAGLGKTPLLPPALLQRRTYLAGVSSLVLQVASYGGFMFVVALTLQSGFQWSSVESGNAFIALGVTYFITSLYADRVAKWFGRLSYSGLVMCASLINLSGYWLLFDLITAQQGALTPWDLIAPMGITGIGNAFSVNCSVRIGLTDLPAQFAGAGSALMTTMQQTAIALGTAMAGAMYIQHLASDDIHQLSALKAGLLVLGFMMLLQFALHAASVVRLLRAAPART